MSDNERKCMENSTQDKLEASLKRIDELERKNNAYEKHSKGELAPLRMFWMNECGDKIELLEKQLAKEREKNAVLSKRVEKCEEIIQYVHDACLCERFETAGFDYHEKHPVFGHQKGCRKHTPKVLIENWLGFEWVYENNRSWKKLKLIEFSGYSQREINAKKARAGCGRNK